jgi:hypothetical protein
MTTTTRAFADACATTATSGTDVQCACSTVGPSSTLNPVDRYRACPLSSTTRSMALQADLQINEYVTDLATECAGRWSSDDGGSLHQNHITVAFRALLDDVLLPVLEQHIDATEQRDAKLVFRRHALRSKQCYDSIENYIDVASNKLIMSFVDRNDKRTLQALPFNVSDYTRQLIERYHSVVLPDMPRLKAFMAVSLALQPVLERLLLLDRQLYLLERGFDDTTLMPLFDTAISPRNMALVSIRSNTDNATTGSAAASATTTASPPPSTSSTISQV